MFKCFVKREKKEIYQIKKVDIANKNYLVAGTDKQIQLWVRKNVNLNKGDTFTIDSLSQVEKIIGNKTIEMFYVTLYGNGGSGNYGWSKDILTNNVNRVWELEKDIEHIKQHGKVKVLF